MIERCIWLTIIGVQVRDTCFVILLTTRARLFLFVFDVSIPYYCMFCEGYGSVIPDAHDAESHSLTKSLAEKVEKCVAEYVEAMEKVRNVI